MFEELGVNIASVVIGALILLIAISWIDFIDALSNHVFFSEKEDGRRYAHELKKKFLSALCVTILAAFLIIIVYVYYMSKKNKSEKEKQPDDNIYESFYNFSGLPYSS